MIHMAFAIFIHQLLNCMVPLGEGQLSTNLEAGSGLDLGFCQPSNGGWEV